MIYIREYYNVQLCEITELQNHLELLSFDTTNSTMTVLRKGFR